MNINNFLLHHINKFFLTGALFAAIAAVYHFYLVFTTSGDTMIRHIVFIFINVLIIYFSLKRPAYFIFIFAILMLQQWYSHGSRFIRQFSEHKLDWISLAVIIIMPFFLYLLILEKKSAR